VYFVAVKRRKGKEGKDLCSTIERFFGEVSSIFLSSKRKEERKDADFFYLYLCHLEAVKRRKEQVRYKCLK
jgi:hypothetical protein